MKLTEDKFKEGDRVYCVLNHSIVGEISKSDNYHGMWLYHIKVEEPKAFKVWIGISCHNAVFLHWQLKIKTEVKKNAKRSTKNRGKASKTKK